LQLNLTEMTNRF